MEIGQILTRGPPLSGMAVRWRAEVLDRRQKGNRISAGRLACRESAAAKCLDRAGPVAPPLELG